MMTRNLGAAVVIAFGVIVATFLHSGIYEFRYAETAPAFVIYRIIDLQAVLASAMA